MQCATCACKDPSTKLAAVIFQHLRGFPALITTFQPVFKIQPPTTIKQHRGCEMKRPEATPPQNGRRGGGAPGTRVRGGSSDTARQGTQHPEGLSPPGMGWRKTSSWCPFPKEFPSLPAPATAAGKTLMGQGAEGPPASFGLKKINDGH